ncbi:MAG: amidohydrolase [Chloroflexota bacterium]|nr:amidohydrolase [Chloroflexota bacterium]
MPRTIDVHSHCIPSAYVEAVRRQPDKMGSRIERNAEGVEFDVQDSGRAIRLGPLHHDFERQLADMDQARIDVMAKSMLPPVFHYFAPVETGVRISRIVNEAIAEAAAAHPDRIVGMGMVPLQGVREAMAELDRCAGEYNMPAVIIGTNVQGKNLDEPQLFPFFERARDLGLLVFVHPEDVAAADRLRRYYLTNFIGNPLETTVAVASLIFGGVLERLPDLKICFAHGGGYCVFGRGRWVHGQSERQEAQAVIGRRPLDDYFKLLHFDTLVHDAWTMEYLIKAVGADRTLLGTDYPADMGNWRQVPLIESLEWLSSEDKAKVLGGNAARLMNLA